MRVDVFDFELPEERIALRPAEPRESARLLDVNPQRDPLLIDRRVGDLPSLLRAGDVVVVNDTRVIPARLSGVRVRGEAVAPADAYNLLRPASGCSHCGHAIRWHENIPVLSFLRLRGRCSACGGDGSCNCRKR